MFGEQGYYKDIYNDKFINNRNDEDTANNLRLLGNITNTKNYIIIKKRIAKIEKELKLNDDDIQAMREGNWLLSDEGLAHYKRKLTNLHKLQISVEKIISDAEARTPKGLAKIFESSKHKIWRINTISNNQTMLPYIQIAIDNTKKAIQCIENEKPIKEYEEIADIKRDCDLLYTALQEEFCPLLDLRDWQDIDIIIYFLETHRAESLKEALQQVDMEKRTDRIVQTIQNAANQICATLEIGFATINDTINRCFNSLERRLSEQNALLSERNTKLAELTSAANLNNSLLQKQHVASKQLIDDVKQIHTDLLTL